MDQHLLNTQDDKEPTGVRALDGTRHHGGRFHRPSPEQQNKQHKDMRNSALRKLEKAKAKYGNA